MSKRSDDDSGATGKGKDKGRDTGKDTDTGTSGTGSSGGEDSEFARLFQESVKNEKSRRYAAGDKVQAEILVIGRDDVYVSIGPNKDGMIQRRELVDAEGNVPHKVGDKIDLYIVMVKGADVRLSAKPTARNLAEDLYDAYRNRLSVEGKVAEVVNGGFRIQMRGKLAFCPISQLDSKRIDQPEVYLGQKFDFRITKFEEGGRNIVVSRRQLLDEERKQSMGAFTGDRKSGDVVTGRVVRLEKFGAFIEMAPGVDGLAHVSELSWSRVGDPSEVLSVGQEVTAKILKMEQEGGRLRISLSLKQMAAEPWDNMPANIVAGQLIEGRVTRCAKFGAFVEIAPGIEGLVPLAEMSHTKRVMRSDEIIREGETVSVMVKEIDVANRRIGLSLKDAGTDPWSLVEHKFPVGSIVKGKFERREAYGLFIKLEVGITGLLPRSKVSEGSDFPFEQLKPGDEVTVQIAELRTSERRISLQPPGDTTESDNWNSYSAQGTPTSGTGAAGGFGSLGDKLKAAMDKNKK